MENKENYLKFNINRYVLVKLKESGYQVLADEHNSYLDTIPNWKEKSIDDFKKDADGDGYTKFQMWDFMSKFGGDIGMGVEQRFETTILINERDVESCEECEQCQAEKLFGDEA